MNSFLIKLRGLRFYSRIGVYEQERVVGNEFAVDVAVRYGAEHFEDENLSTTISYADIYAIVAEAMQREWMLLESAAKGISERISKRWAEVEEIRVTIEKATPPICGIMGSAAVEYFWKKS